MIDTLLLGGIFISLLAGQFARIELINSLVNVYVHEFLMVLYISYSLFSFGLRPIRVLVKSKGVIVLFIIVIISYFVSFPEFTAMQNAVAALYFGRVVLYIVFGIYLFSYLRKGVKAKEFLYRCIYTFSILLLVVTAVQYVFFPNFWGITQFGWDPHLYRASAIYLDIFIAAAIYGLLAFFWYEKEQNILSGFFVLALAMSLSRSAYIAFGISLIYLFITQRKWKELFISLLTFILLIVAMPKPFGEGGNLLRTASIEGRMQDFSRGISLFQKKPLLGFGYNRIRAAKELNGLIDQDDKSHSLASFHSSFLIILVTTGIVGFFSSMYLLGTFFQKYSALRVYAIYLISMSLFDNVLLHALVILPFLFIAAYSSLE